VRLPYRAPYDWDAMASYFIGRAIPGVETATEDSYARTVEIDGVRGVVRVRPGKGDHLDVEVVLTKLTVLSKVIARVRRVFDLAADPATIDAHLYKDPALRPLVKKRPGLRLPGAWDGFELGVRAVLGQQITVTAARNLAGVLAQTYGAPLDPELTGDEALARVFPAPEAFARADLSDLPMPRSRSSALGALAQSFIDDPGLFGPTRALDEAVDRLTALKGIGPWTAHYIAMRALREPDAFPAADIGLLRALETPDGVRPTPAELNARAEAWRPWRAYAAQHLWSADAAPDLKIKSNRGQKNADQYAA
jgi:AraC family transcriptional regulator of adaptative response / DNA-3-methyladenine glycosylase II